MCEGVQNSVGGFSREECQFLLRLARRSLAAGAEGRNLDPDLSQPPDSLRLHRGCFVTLFKKGELRGCIGHVRPQMPLYKAVSNNACAAGIRDSRFDPVSPGEVKDITIEISVLSELRPVDANDATGILAALRPGVDGVVLCKGGQMSTFLPQVWEMLPDKEEFLARLCVKGGWEAEVWKDSGCAVATYQVLAFSDHSM